MNTSLRERERGSEREGGDRETIDEEKEKKDEVEEKKKKRIFNLTLNVSLQ